MNYYRPSHGTVDALFRIAAKRRPFLDLHMTMPGMIGEWAPHMRKIFSGPSRWGNLLVGLAVDRATPSDPPPEEVNARLQSGNIALHAVFFENTGEPINDENLPVDRIRFRGMVVAQDHTLSIAGMHGAGHTISLMRFFRGSSFVIPEYTGESGPLGSEPNRYTLPIPLTPQMCADQTDIPPSLLPCRALGELEEKVTESLGAGTLIVKTQIVIPSAL